MSEKQNKKGLKITYLRRVVQVIVLILFCLPLVVAGWSLLGLTGSLDEAGTPANLVFYGTLSSSSIFGVTLLDPFAVLQVICASKSFALDWLIGCLPVLIVYGLIRGRVFCGWVCPVNLVLELVDFIRGKVAPKQKLPEQVLPRHVKLYVALGILVLSAVLSVPLFEALSPLSAINKLLVLGSTTGLITLVAIILVEVFWGHRVWCRALCPLGGFYEALGKVGVVNVKIDHESCIKCNKCKKACLCDPVILEPAVDGQDVAVVAGDCMLCGKCVDVCPTASLKIGVGRK